MTLPAAAAGLCTGGLMLVRKDELISAGITKFILCDPIVVQAGWLALEQAGGCPGRERAGVWVVVLPRGAGRDVPGTTPSPPSPDFTSVSWYWNTAVPQRIWSLA